MGTDKITGEITVSEGLKTLVSGYTTYARETILERALPRIDGFKPVHRRILYMMHLGKIKENTKSSAVVGNVMKLHPHGDSSIYNALVRMVDSAEVMQMPFVKGKGSFGKVFDETAPSASRYTECRLAPLASELFGEMDGVTMIPSEDDSMVEPLLLPVSFPAILCNATQGVAVGLASNIPSFNFNEVLNATIEYLETGSLSTYLLPDFTTGGEVVLDEAELHKLMYTGRARLKYRGKWYVDGKTITITEVPYYTTVEKILAVARLIPGVAKANDSSDKDHGVKIDIECSSKKHVDSVVYTLLKDSNLQMTDTSNIQVVTSENKPEGLGILGVIKEWVIFRKKVLEKQITHLLKVINYDIKNYELLSLLLSDKEKRDKFISLVVEDANSAQNYLRVTFKEVGITEEQVSWVMGLSLRSLSKERKDKLNSLYAQKAEQTERLSNLEGVIVGQLKALNAKYVVPRKTQPTTTDYQFTTEKETKIESVSTVYVTIDGKFIKKTTYSENPTFVCNSNDTVICIDNKGRIIRVFLDLIPMSGNNGKGTYIPVYLEGEDDFEIIAYNLLENKKLAYMYDDGYVGVVDYSEWSNGLQRRSRVTDIGVSPLAGQIIGEFTLDSPHYLVFSETGKAGVFSSNFKQKHRTARTKVIDVKNEKITHVIPLSDYELLHSGLSAKAFGCLKPLDSQSLNMEMLQMILNRQ